MQMGAFFDRWRHSSTNSKFIAVGSVLLAIAVLLPWWQIDKIGLNTANNIGSGMTTVTFNGLTGITLYGLLLLGIAAFSGYCWHLRQNGRKQLAGQPLPTLLLVAGVSSLLLIGLLLYTLLTIKLQRNFVGDASLELRFGIWLALLGGLLLTSGGQALHAQQQRLAARAGFAVATPEAPGKTSKKSDTNQLSF